ncbi:Aste57867_3157 [Aphanomyces stellatus]|uniref:Aste57867_3157 protein n=1 Tax=Aphanomyces stellatus TaxID=120398 RepID=A0A485K9S3_9STRA|nr:hypothetical protein As57867_003148 [Aphanomyces stellatus]VFT80331.1 Aste57867_3157 [Aphanomyces stellatus]
MSPYFSHVGLPTESRSNHDAFISTGFVYFIVFLVCTVQLVRNCRSYGQWTQQKTVHVLLFLLTAIRTGFLLAVGLYDWCQVAVAGVLSDACEKNAVERQAFYILDQLPNMLFFSIYLVMGLFWAEIYYNATDQLEVFTHVVKPVSKVIHVAAYLLQLGLWGLYADPWRSEDHYFGRGYAAFSATVFGIVTVAFLVFGRLAFVELRAVPVDLPIRAKKLKEVTAMTTICTTCFTCRSLLVLYLSQDHVQLSDHLTWVMIVLYYSIFELLPIVVILHFHRRFPRPDVDHAGAAYSPVSKSPPKKAPYRFIVDAAYDDESDSDTDALPLSPEDPLRQSLIAPSSP